MDPAMFYLALRLDLKRFIEQFEGEGVEAFAYMDNVSLGLMGVTANTVSLSFPSARSGRHRYLGQTRQDRGTTTEWERPGARGDFAPGKR